MITTSVKIETFGKNKEVLTEEAWEESFDSLEALKLRLFNLKLKGFKATAFKKTQTETLNGLVKKETFLERFISKGQLVERRVDFFPAFGTSEASRPRLLA